MTTDLQLSLYRLQLHVQRAMCLDTFPGITFEGALVTGIRELSCGCRSDDATAACPIRRRCAFHLLARPSPEHFSDLPKRFRTPSSPIVLRPRFAPGIYPSGSKLELQLVLVGKARESFRWVIGGLAWAGQRGVGKDRRGCFDIERVDVLGPLGETKLWEESRAGSSPHPAWRFPADFTAPPHVSPTSSLTLELRSPTLISKAGAHRGSLEFVDVVSKIASRASTLGLAYGEGNPVGYTEHARLQELAGSVRIAAQSCQWHAWDRGSQRQKRSFRVQGWTGWIRYEGDLAPFLPLLRLASLIHVGSDTIRGLGEIAVQTTP